MQYLVREKVTVLVSYRVKRPGKFGDMMCRNDIWKSPSVFVGRPNELGMACVGQSWAVNRPEYGSRPEADWFTAVHARRCRDYVRMCIDIVTSCLIRRPRHKDKQESRDIKRLRIDHCNNITCSPETIQDIMTQRRTRTQSDERHEGKTKSCALDRWP